MLSPNPFSVYQVKLQDLLFVTVLSLLLMGVLMVQSAAVNINGELGIFVHPLAQRHGIYVILAVAAFFTVGHMDYRKLLPRSVAFAPPLDEAKASSHGTEPVVLSYRPARRLAQATVSNPAALIFIASVVLCALVLVPHIGKEVNGARRWLALGPIQLQPSELAKWASVILLAWLFSARGKLLQSFPGFLVTLVPIGIICLFIVAQDFGTAALIGIFALALAVVAGARLWHVAVLLPPVLGAAYWFVKHKPYRWKRITAFWDPFGVSQDEGYHMVQSLLSFSTGGLSGTGLGMGVQKLGYLPEDTTDFIFAVIAEEMGIFGVCLTIVLYLGILLITWQAARQIKNPFGRLLAFGIGSMLCIQALMNMAVATVSVPTKGISLPLISAGGTGLIISCAALGLFYSVLRHSDND